MERATASPTVPSFAALLAQPGVVERSALSGTFGFMAFHGGALEQRTDVIAQLAAEASGASLYTVALPGPEPEHFPSTSVRREESPALDEFFDHVDVVVTVHGYGRWGRFTSLLLGGSNRELAAKLAEVLGPALPDYDVVLDLEAIPRELRGLHPDNPVNVPRLGGVQLELPPRVRGLGPRGSQSAMANLVGSLARVAREF
jgi:phage replication-related protein YjqB (UPF0714/DUF867 family)